MNKIDFIKQKLNLLAKDKQSVFQELGPSLQQMADKEQNQKIVKIPADGNWFTISYDAVEVRADRLVISAKRKLDGMHGSPNDPDGRYYVVEFEGTRAAYLRGMYKHRHRAGGWPYIYWDIRSYAGHPSNPGTRVYVSGFKAHDELRKMINAMENIYGTKNIVNTYINDNLMRFQTGIMQKKTPQQIEKQWSQGLMESMGYKYVEASDVGYPKGSWKGVASHWHKNPEDALS